MFWIEEKPNMKKRSDVKMWKLCCANMWYVESYPTSKNEFKSWVKSDFEEEENIQLITSNKLVFSVCYRDAMCWLNTITFHLNNAVMVQF